MRHPAVSAVLGLMLLLAAPAFAQTAGGGAGSGAASNAGGTTWTRCAVENQTCTFAGTQTVRYGANGTFVTRIASGPIGCNNGIFGDPTPGTIKACDVQTLSSAGSGTASNAGGTTWTRCAVENQTCTFAGTQTVRYGANGTFFMLSASGPIGCNNGTFGDPTPGAVKACDVQTLSAAGGTASSGSGTSADAANTSWVRCATEGQSCGFTGTQTVRFGANGQYLTQSATGSVSCSVAGFGSDPIYGTPKACDVQVVQTPGAPTTTVWITCATENQTCTFTGTQTVRYGANGLYLTATATNALLCASASFGSDPLPGIPKSCQIPATTTVGVPTAGGTGPGGTATGGTPPGDTPPSGVLSLINRQSGMCIEVPGAQANAGQALDQTTCTGAPEQNWSFVSAGASGWQIKNAASGTCLWVDRGQSDNGVALVQQTCGSTLFGGFWQTRSVDGWSEIVNLASSRCATVANGSRDIGGGLVQSDCTTVDNQRFTLPRAALPSSWTAPRNVGLVPLTGAALPNGKLLLWASNAPNQWLGGGGGAGTYTTLYDPATDTATNRYVGQTGHDLVCPGTDTLADGRVVITGGDDEEQNVSIYDPATDTWSRGPQMNIAHNYQGATTLSGGESMVFGGSWLNNQGNKFAEVWSPSSGSWRLLKNVNGNDAAQPGVDIGTSDSHFWLFAQSNGFVFQAGPPQIMHWIDTRGDGVLTSAGLRGDDQFAINGNAVMYDVGKILKVGGATQYRDGSPALDAAYTIDITGGPGATPVVQKTAPLAMARTYSNSVVLPSGDVVVLGGMNNATVFSDNGAVMTPEIWSPKTGQFSRLAAMSVPRDYHSIALLMPDGRVVSGAGGLCGCGADHPDFQILSPPYLFGADGKPASRPVITAAPSTAPLGSALTVSTDRAATSFALVRMSATTHSVNNDQRRVPLVPTATSGTTYQFQLSADPGVLLPGNWMLFAMDSNGVPSVAKVVRIN